MNVLLIKTSVFVKQNSTSFFFDTPNRWVILSSEAQTIAHKIESKGKKLKECAIKMYRGILTGYNDAFIITGETRRKLIEEDPKSEEIIRPILRGRDIQRYSYQFADLWLISTFPSKNYNIDKYPAIKNHLLSFGVEKQEPIKEILRTIYGAVFIWTIFLCQKSCGRV